MKKVMLERLHDKMVFGTYKAVRTVTHKEYKIKNGDVCIKFRGKWFEVVEVSETRNNRLQRQLAGLNYPAVVEIVWQ